MSEEATMNRPQFRYEVNLNTALLFVTLIATGVGWGVAYSALVSGRDTNAANIKRLEDRVVALETTGRILDNHEQRIGVVERDILASASNARALQDSIAKLATDMAVVREILQRLEKTQDGSR